MTDDFSKTIAIIGTLDTKEVEVKFLKDRIEKMGLKTLIIDVGYKNVSTLKADIENDVVKNASSVDWNRKDLTRIDVVGGFSEGIAKLLPELHSKGLFDGVISIGGAQNTIIAASGMQKLPIGFPKLIVSTTASGHRTFGDVVGTKDILVMPSVADIAGINIITSVIINNAAAAIVGMAKYATDLDIKDNKIRIGSTLMGVIDKGSKQINKIMEDHNAEVTSFHSTGVGGQIFEELISKDTFDMIIDFSLHEITSEYFDKGYSVGATDRLLAAGKKGLPQVIIPGAIDFIDFAPNEIPEYLKDRKMQHHNAGIVHIKLSVNEITDVAKIICERLNQSTGLVSVVVPTKGFRQQSQVGEALYDKEVDDAFINVLKKDLNENINLILVDANVNDQSFSNIAAKEALVLLKKSGINLN